MHGANRLGGNGVANSTVFGGIAGETIAAWLAENRGASEPDAAAIDSATGSMVPQAVAPKSRVARAAERAGERATR